MPMANGDWRHDPTLAAPTAPDVNVPRSSNPAPGGPPPGRAPARPAGQPPAGGYGGRPSRDGQTLDEGRPRQPDGRNGRQDGTWRGVAPVRAPGPPLGPTLPEEPITPIETISPYIDARPRRPEPYLRPGLPRPKPSRPWRGGGGWSVFGLIFAFLCWGVWAASKRGALQGFEVLISLGIVVAVAAGVFLLSRLIGRVILEGWRGRARRSARISHLLTWAFLMAAGVGYLKMTSWIITALRWIGA